MKMKDSKTKEAWTQFLADIDRARKELGCCQEAGTEAWFRGHTRSDYQLMPSLFRAFKDPNKSKTWRRIFNIESDLFYEFSARAHELHGVIEDDWDILFTMQHYGTPTRLLDWTEILGVAVYFAILGIDERELRFDSGKEAVPPPCVWVLNPYELNNNNRWVSTGSEADLVYPVNLGWDPDEQIYYTYSDLLLEGYLDWKWPVAIYPRQRNVRMHAQRAWFTIHGDEFIPFDKIKGYERFLKKVILPFEAIESAKRFMELAGINHYLLFADLESLSLHVQERNGLINRKEAEAKAKALVDRRDVVVKRN